MRTCSVPNCDRKHYARGFCNTHYMRLRNGTDMDAPIRGSGPRTCTHDGCDRKHFSKGYCQPHYERLRKGRDMDAPIRGYGTKTCSVPHCDRKHVANGYCQLHWKRLIRGADMYAPTMSREAERPDTCTHPGCDRKHRAKGYCQAHYNRHRRGADMDAPMNKPRTEGRRIVISTVFLRTALGSETNCTECGGTFPAHVIEHDHLPGFKKRGSPSGLSGRNLYWEANVMQPVCANCHRTRTYLRREYDENSCDGAQRPNLVEWVRSGVPS